MTKLKGVYGLVDGKHLVTRSEFDDGAATIGGEPCTIVFAGV
jgi:hypothetical protein